MKVVTPKAQATIHDKITAYSGNTDTSWSVVTATYGTPNAFRWKGSLIYHLLQSDTVYYLSKNRKHVVVSRLPTYFFPQNLWYYMCVGLLSI